MNDTADRALRTLSWFTGTPSPLWWPVHNYGTASMGPPVIYWRCMAPRYESASAAA